MESKENLIVRAKLAEQADRHNDMAELMLKVIEQCKEMNAEERNLFSFAFKNTIGSRRNSWRVISVMEEKADDSNQKKQLAKEYREKIEGELREICSNVLNALDKVLIPNACTPESKVFYIKMKADYYRYIAEITVGVERQDIVDKSRAAYAEAFDIAKDKMDVAHPIRLGLALNFSVFYYEIAASPEQACQLAKQAFDDALDNLTVTDDTHKDSAMILQLLRDNLTLWTQDSAEEASGHGMYEEAIAVVEQEASGHGIDEKAIAATEKEDD